MGNTLTTSVVTKNELKVVAKKCVGLQNIVEGTTIKVNADELASLAGRIPSWTNKDVHYGIALASQFRNEYEPEKHVYYIGIEVDNFDDVPNDLECITIPSGKYALIHKDIENNVGDIYSIWAQDWTLHENGFTFEHFYESIQAYSDRVNGRTSQEFKMDLCVPLK